jgi:apolipoprotein N-acyltransferase
VDLLVWPENALPVLLPANAHLVEDVLESLPARPARLLMGAPRSARDRPGVVFNSAMLFDAAGRPLDAHDKVHLVPFTEYLPVPFSALDSGRSWLAAGASPRTLELEQGVRLGPLVCYEMLFAGLARELVAEGAGFLVNLSNDGWFGGTAGAEQHLAAAVLRAIELRRPVLRATSDGITVAIDAGGRMVGRLPSAAPGALVVDVVPARHPSVGMQAGRWLPLAAGVGLILLARTSTRAKPPRTS